jgi:hypothetical protein
MDQRAMNAFGVFFIRYFSYVQYCSFVVAGAGLKAGE